MNRKIAATIAAGIILLGVGAVAVNSSAMTGHPASIPMTSTATGATSLVQSSSQGAALPTATGATQTAKAESAQGAVLPAQVPVAGSKAATVGKATAVAPASATTGAANAVSGGQSGGQNGNQNGG